jgi:hypothetical protein
VSHIVTALYDTRVEADRALHALRSEVSLAHGGVYDRAHGGLEALQGLDLTSEERTACEAKLATGEYLLLAQAPSEDGLNGIVAVLERISADPPAGSQAAPAPEQGTSGSGPAVVSEERIPIAEEQLRVGTREVVRGGARVRTRVEEVPFVEDVELLKELVRVETRPTSRPVSQQELEAGGLLRERVVEIAQVREEAVISKDVFVREEVVVRKTTERHVETVRDTVRRTVVETEDLGSGLPDRTEQPERGQ